MTACLLFPHGLHVGTQVEEFRLSTSTSESVDACRRALRSLEWTEQASDRLRLPLIDMAVFGSFLLHPVGRLLYRYVPIARRVVDRYFTRRAPEGPPHVDAEINAVLGQRLIVRISLQERGGFGTDVTISGSDLGGADVAFARPLAELRSAIRELRRSIEIQSGAVAPDQPAT